MTRDATKMQALALLTSFSLALVGCGGGGGGGGGGSSASTGQVGVALTDAPLASLASLTIDVSDITLKGAGVADFSLFNSATPVTIDLLSLQGLNQLFASASVPVGRYHSIDFSFANPQATDMAGAAQTVNVANNVLHGVFAPPLVVTQSSTQSIQVDVDLQRSVIDQGPTALFLAPVVLVQVLGANQTLPLRQVRGLVTAVDTTADQFTLGLRVNGSGPASGGVTVQCSATTSFTDGAGNTSTGMVTSQLQVGAFVGVDGVLTAQRQINADSVVLLNAPMPPNPSPNPSPNPVPPTTNLPDAVLEGTLTAVNAQAGTLELLVQSAFGRINALPARGSRVTVNVPSSASVRRGRSSQGLGAMVPGNSCQVLANVSNQTFTARDVDERPALVTGTISGVSAGTGPNSGDVVSFTPAFVNQVPVAQLSFLAATLSVEVPSGFAAQVGDRFRVIAFFTSSSQLQIVGPLSVGVIPTPPTTTPPPVNTTLAGLVDSGTPATSSNAGISFTLRANNASAATVSVLVTPGASLSLFTAGSSPVSLSVADAVTALNSNPALVELVGAPNPTTRVFEASVALRIYAAAPNPQPGPSPAPQPGPGIIDVLGGQVSGQAVLNSAGEIEFSLDVSGPFANAPVLVSVTVRASAIKLLHQRRAAPQPVSPAMAVQELNSQPMAVQVEGRFNPQARSFDCTRALLIFK